MIQKPIIYISIVLLIFSCSKELNNNLEVEYDIDSTYINYSYDGFATIDAQIRFNSNFPSELIDSVWIEIAHENYSDFHQQLYDDETNGDPISGDGSYNVNITIPEIENGIYDVNFNYDVEGEIGLVSINTIKISYEESKPIIKLLELLEEHEDIQKLYSNFEVI